LLSVIVAWLMVRRHRYFVAFFFSAADDRRADALGIAVGLYPNLLVSTLDPQYNLTIYNAASAPNTLTVMLVFALVGMPFVLLYTAGVYYVFRGRVQLGPESY
jgi:cytochrome d ubiquinol oxidase subunit II